MNRVLYRNSIVDCGSHAFEINVFQRTEILVDRPLMHVYPEGEKMEKRFGSRGKRFLFGSAQVS